MSRYLYMAIENRIKWDLFLDLHFPDLVNDELMFWFKHFRVLNKKGLANTLYQLFQYIRMQVILHRGLLQLE